MNTWAITDFAFQFGVQIALNLDLMVENTGRFYLVNPALKPMIVEKFLFCRSLFRESEGGQVLSKLLPAGNAC